MDNVVVRAIDRFVDLIWLNVLTLVCALPVVTAGASLTAMNHVLLKMTLREEGPVAPSFLKAFRENFKNATCVWLVMLAIWGAGWYNIYLLKAGVMHGMGKWPMISGGVIALIALYLLMVSNYIFPLLARYDNGVKQTVLNAVLLSFAYFPRSLCMLVILFFPLALMMLSNYFFWLWFLYGLAFPCYVNAQLLAAIFRKTEEAQRK